MLILPEVPKSGGRQLGVAHRVLEIFVAKVRLQRPGIVTGIGERIAASVAKHVGMSLDLEGRRCRCPLDHAAEPRG